jgi:prephenate dehydrogenase
MPKRKEKPIAGIDGGAGVMGTHEIDLLRKDFDVRIFDVDKDKANYVSKELRCGVVDSPEELMEISKLFVFSLPGNTVDSEMRRFIPKAKEGTCITDVSSVKKMPMNAMAESVPEGVNYFGSHPNYRGTISPHGQTLIICNGRPEDGSRYQRMFEYAHTRKGAKIAYMSPEEADHYSDINQALAHDTYLSFMGVLLKLQAEGGLDMNKLLATSTPNSKRLLQNIGRMLGGKSHVYGGIQLFKDGSIGMIDKMIDALQNQKNLLTGATGQKPTDKALADFSEYFESMRDLLGQEFVLDACTTTDAQYEVPGGMGIYYKSYGRVSAGAENILRKFGAKSFHKYKDDIIKTSIPVGGKQKLAEKMAIAECKFHKKMRVGRYTSGEQGDSGSTSFYCKNRKIDNDMKGIRFAGSFWLNPDDLFVEDDSSGLVAMNAQQVYEVLQEEKKTSAERHPYYTRVQLLPGYDDPILRFFLTIDSFGYLTEMGPWAVCDTKPSRN